MDGPLYEKLKTPLYLFDILILFYQKLCEKI